MTVGWLLMLDGAIGIEVSSYLHFYVDRESRFVGIKLRRGAFLFWEALALNKNQFYNILVN